MHHGDAVGKAHGLRLVMRHIESGGAGLLQHAQLGPHLQAQERVEVGERLVHQQHRRLDRERARHRHALALPARELRGIAVEIGLDMEEGSGLLDLARDEVARLALLRRGLKPTLSRTVICGKTA